ncbi:MAG: Xaa-Pro peptidase family protein [Mesorhizobium sp.]|nr:Xaa-Pro peptidase family protein [Mesorhizobium sp.]
MKKDLSFAVEEFETRLARLREEMARRGLDLLILDEIEAMTWICGYGVSETLWRAVGIPIKGEPFLVLRSLDVAPARERSWFEDIVGFRDWDDPVEAFAAEVTRRNLGSAKIGVDFNSHSMTLNRFAQLCSALADATFKDFGQAVWQLRWIKSEAEIAYLRKAAAVADAAMASAVKAVRAGGRQRDVVKAAASTYLDMGADDGLVGPLTSGSDWDSLHGHEHDHVLRDGEVVHIELVPRVREYSSRIMRSAIVGCATVEQFETAERLIAAQDKQLKALRPGALASDIDAIVRDALLEGELRPSYDNVSGYTLGFYPASTQRISDFTRAFTPRSEWRIEKGMTLHMYTSAKGLAISETMLVTSTGAERLTQTPRQIFQCA